MTGIDCAMAGDAMDAPAAPAADAFRKSRRFMKHPRNMLEPGLSELRASKKDYRNAFRTGLLVQCNKVFCAAKSPAFRAGLSI
jgi:hypothetical protein